MSGNVARINPVTCEAVDTYSDLLEFNYIGCEGVLSERNVNTERESLAVLQNYIAGEFLHDRERYAET